MGWSSEQADYGAFLERRRVAEPEVRSESPDRAKQHELLLREMQHRIANSLQIVAGILLQKAAAVESGDARLHLLDAYGRVMAVAAVQRQLLESRQSSMIRLDHYLTELSKRLTESLTDKVSLSVTIEGSVTWESDKAVAIGLIVTELITNALRHAFPGSRCGKIDVTFNAIGSVWSLSVSDNGVGHPNASVAPARPGYGTKIIDALTRKLDAHVGVESSPKGTRVTVVHGAVSELILMNANQESPA